MLRVIHINKREVAARPWSPSQASVLLVLLLRLASCDPQVVPHLCVHEGPHEDKEGAQPVPRGERVLEVQDGDDEAHKLA